MKSFVWTIVIFILAFSVAAESRTYGVLPIEQEISVEPEIPVKVNIGEPSIAYSGEIKEQISKQKLIALPSNQAVTVINIDFPGKPKRLSTNGKFFDLSEGITVEIINDSIYDATNIRPLPSAVAPSTSGPLESFVDFVKKIPAFFKNLFKK